MLTYLADGPEDGRYMDIHPDTKLYRVAVAPTVKSYSGFEPIGGHQLFNTGVYREEPGVLRDMTRDPDAKQRRLCRVFIYAGVE